MNYETVYLNDKTVVGLKIRTRNDDPGMTAAIGQVWQKFFEEGYYQSIPNKVNNKTIGLYTNYDNDVNGAYDMVVCCETSNASEASEGTCSIIIPAGKYAKFVVNGDVQKAVNEFWQKLWSMNLDRKYNCDFEEYQGSCDTENEEIHIYISLK